MGRLQLIELEDQPWYPKPVRDGATDFLAFAGNLLEAPYSAFIPRLKDALTRLGDDRLLDLCSGGSGPVQMLVKLLRKEGLSVKATLTDLYPNRKKLAFVAEHSHGAIDFLDQPVEATAVPAELSGFRTLCNAFHHFSPELALRILKDATDKRQGIAVLEFVERTPAAMASIPFAMLQSFLVTPFIRPFRPSRVVFSWLLPLIPFTVLFDGLVSCVRVYSVDELRALTEQLGPVNYEWDIRRDAFGPFGSTSLIGLPRERLEAAG